MMGIKEFLIAVIFIFCTTKSFSQEATDSSLENVLRLNFINLSLGYDWAVSTKSLLSTDLGIGYSGAFKEITVKENSGFQYVIAPFVGVQYKFIYDRNKRKQKGGSLAYNSGNFVSIRGRGRGSSITENLTRTDNFDFSISSTWGLQRSYNKISFLFDVGPIYYFDTLGNSGFFPIAVQINLGLNLSKSK